MVDGMGWIVEAAPDHEGWVANVLDDGRATGATTGGGVIPRAVTSADREAGYEIRRFASTGQEEVVVPWERVTTWQVRCECGWTGRTQPAYITHESGSRDCPEDLEDEYFVPQWREHIAPFTALGDLEQLVHELRSFEERTAAAVMTARRHGASWSQVGRAAGLTRQGAQQRWGG